MHFRAAPTSPAELHGSPGAKNAPQDDNMDHRTTEARGRMACRQSAETPALLYGIIGRTMCDGKSGEQ